MGEKCSKCNREMKYLADQFRFVCPSCDRLILTFSDPSSPLYPKPTQTAESIIAKNKHKHGNSAVITENSVVSNTSTVVTVNGKTVVQSGSSVSVVGNGNTVVTSENSHTATQINGNGNTVSVNTENNTSVSFSGTSVTGNGNVSCNISGVNGKVDMSINNERISLSITPEPATYVGTMGGTLPPNYPDSKPRTAPLFLCTDPKAPRSAVPPTEVNTEPPNENDIHVYIFDGTGHGKLRRSSWGETDYQLAVRSLTQRKNRRHTMVIAEEYNEKFPENYRAKQTLSMAISEYLTRSTSDMILSGDCAKFTEYTEKAAVLAPEEQKLRFGSAVNGYVKEIQEKLILIRTLTDLEKRERELILATPKEPSKPTEDAVNTAKNNAEALREKLAYAETALLAAKNDDTPERLAATPLPKTVFGKKKLLERRSADITMAQNNKQINVAQAENTRNEIEKQLLTAVKELEQRESEYRKLYTEHAEALKKFDETLIKYKDEARKFKEESDKVKALPLFEETVVIITELRTKIAKLEEIKKAAEYLLGTPDPFNVPVIPPETTAYRSESGIKMLTEEIGHLKAILCC